MTTAVLIILAVFVLPLVVYLTVKLGTAGYFRGRRAYEVWLAKQKLKDEEVE